MGPSCAAHETNDGGEHPWPNARDGWTDMRGRHQGPICAGVAITEANKSFARRYLDEFWSTGNLALANEMFVPTYVRHDPEGPMTGLDAIRRFIATIRADFPDLHFTADDMLAEGDRVMVRWTSTGTHAPTNRGIPFAGMGAATAGVCPLASQMLRIGCIRLASAPGVLSAA